ncbi:neutral amino acid transporter A [Echinococcus multilocularis]|uniref:Amino acid transporter n=1 Tax=Echinococcus multilocularis TaxID=6211 RepID=A0A068XTR8_ECHMU|nr:neutral amino acid transporter A [Echinococcus multilocularis]
MADSKVPAEEAVYDDEDETVVSERKKRTGFVGCLINNWFMVTTIIGVIIGFGAGFGIQRAGLDETGKTWLAMPGTIYIRLLKLTILPMISANIINVMANLNPKENGKVSAIALGFILVFNLLSALIGVAYSYIINPGKGNIQTPGNGSTSQSNLTSAGNQISYIFKDLLLNIFPDNIVGVTINQAGTDFNQPQNTSKGEIVYPSTTVSGTNMIGVLFCSLAFGIAANAAKEKGEPFKHFFASLGEIVMLLMQKFLLITPVGVMFMVMSSIAEVDDITETFISLGFFVLLNVVGQLTHFIFLLLSLIVLCKNPFTILKYSFPSYFIAFATTSAVVCLPKAFIACDKYGIPQRISRFVLPFAGTMKSDASAVFIAASCLFVAQQANVELDAGKVVIVIILSFAYVTALPNIPSASVVAVVTILASIGVDERGASLLYAVEFINDRLRSGNVALSHIYCSAFTYHATENDVVEEEGEGDLEAYEWGEVVEKK